VKERIGTKMYVMIEVMPFALGATCLNGAPPIFQAAKVTSKETHFDDCCSRMY